MVDVCRLVMDEYIKQFRNPPSVYKTCPEAALTLLDNFKVDLSKRTTECQITGCWWAYFITAGYVTQEGVNCPITDISTNTIVPPNKVNCTEAESRQTLPPVSTRAYDPTPAASSSASGSSPVATSTTASPAIASTAVVASSDSSVTIVIVVAATVIVLLGIFVVWRLRVVKRDRGDSFHQLHDNTKQTAEVSTEGATTNFNPDTSFLAGSEDDTELLAMWRIPPNEIVMECRLAEGAFGEVWRGSYRGEAVAVKMLHKHKSSMADIRVFIDEIKLVAKMDCEAIVQFVGVSYHRLVDVKMVTEFMSGGDLRTVLHESNDVSFPVAQKLECAIRIADALVFMHVMEPKVIHRDLKSRNVLLDPVKGAKLTDFGVSREAIDHETLTQGVGTYRWMAPEVLVDGHYTTSADMYSFGVILTELNTHEIPYADRKNATGGAMSDTAIIAQVIRGDLKPSFRPDADPWFVEFALKCLDSQPVNRPTAMEAAYFLRMALRREHGSMPR
ncbi:TKL protein kinase [Aphanomyces invadans]|uniref:TKL protein kinase n=1 Tax=Aphanomyces invadans TaxID=157072 RepID=A0A024UAI3_9STRA|nr:TKL protein kinase [Aphanomyces invadans]ETW02643.1 TKL protein kinase [Aphanomyces invadans]|eukprot:XP_008869248.1 TKL protein kinase [Aphanomyces invadans]